MHLTAQACATSWLRDSRLTQNGSCEMSVCMSTAQVQEKIRHLVISYRNLASDFFFRELVPISSQETLGDLVQRPGGESRGLAPRSFIAGQSYFEIPCKNLPWRQTPFTETLAESCTAVSTEEILRTILSHTLFINHVTMICKP